MFGLTDIDQCEYNDVQSESLGESDLATIMHPEIVYFANPKVPKVPGTLHGCPLRVSSSVWEPYSYYDTDEQAFTKGIEVLLIETIAKVLQMKVEFWLISETRENRVADQPSEGFEKLVNR